MSIRKNILSIGNDAKTIKGNKIGYLTGILYLAPHTLAGRETVCPMSKLAACETGCLYSAGRGAFTSIQKARIAKTIRFFDDRENFMLDLIYSIEGLIRKANKLGLTPLVRLNGTSDIQWEKIAITNKDGVTYDNIMDIFPSVQHYDYTKIPTRNNLPANYDLTFSYSGVITFQKAVKKANTNIELSRMAVVFDKAENIPKSFLLIPVIAGDNSDVRHTEPKGVIVALYAKGKARHDQSGFVVRA